MPGHDKPQKCVVFNPYEAFATWVFGILFLVMAIFSVFRDFRVRRSFADLEVYRHATSLMNWSTASLYRYRSPIGDAFNYPPWAAIVLRPTGFLPPFAAAICWVFLSVGVVYWLAFSMTKRFWPRIAQPSCIFLIGSVLLVTAPMQSNLKAGQVSVFIFALVIYDMLLLESPTGVWLGFASAVKLVPLIFVPYLFLTGRRRAAVVTLAIFALLEGVSFLVIPEASRTYWSSGGPDTAEIPGVWGYANQSMLAAIHRTGQTGPSLAIWWGIAAAGVGALALLAASRLHGERYEIKAVVTIGCASILISPISWTHHEFWLLLVPVMLFTPQTENAPRFRAALITVTCFFNVGVVLGGLSYLHWVALNLRLFICFAVVTAPFILPGLERLVKWPPSRDNAA